MQYFGEGGDLVQMGSCFNSINCMCKGSQNFKSMLYVAERKHNVGELVLLQHCYVLFVLFERELAGIVFKDGLGCLA